MNFRYRLRLPADAYAVVFLILIWLLFFWRLFTPIDADRVTLVDGDFSGQFVAFGAYQYSRLTEGEIPLWNPYNNAGLPFIADTQAAVFYPPRLLTIFFSKLSGGWRYNALQMEMVFHALAYTILLYAFMRRLLLGIPGGLYGALVTAVVGGYGGFMTGYPPLQLALMEAAIWLPLGLLGILEATRDQRRRWGWLALTGMSLGLSWMAGHPQTGWFSTYALVAYFAYRIYQQGWSWRDFVSGTLFFGAITAGIVAVQLLPAIEYIRHSIRADLGFDAKGGGFPFQDVAQFLFPGIVSLWSPLFAGVTGITLAVIGAAAKGRDYRFWSIAALIALALSVGANSAVYHTLYNLLPGLNLFRGQERAAFIVSVMVAILAGLGTSHILTQPIQRPAPSLLRRGLLLLAGFCGVFAIVIFIAWLGNREAFGEIISPVVFSAVIAALLLVLLHFAIEESAVYWRWLLVGLVVFELFSVNIDNGNFETRPAWDRDPLAVPNLVAQVQADDEGLFRVDGNFLGLYGNYASIFQLYDIRGISPLFLNGPHTIIQRLLPSEVAWELFAVRYVLTQAPSVPAPAELMASDFYRDEMVYLHRLEDPRPFAQLMYEYEVLDSDGFAWALLADPNYDERGSIILSRDPGLTIPDTPSPDNTAVITEYRPERFTVEVNTAENAILSLAHVDYPGWRATLDGEPVTPIRAYGALTAVSVPAGEHVITFVYDPPLFKIGAGLSLFTWASLGILGIVLALRYRTRNASE